MSKALQELVSHSHEHVSIFQRPEVGLTAIIAVHDTTLGPALGGCRMNLYPDFDEALYDALRLAEGMTYKNSLAGLSLGGGKSVIIADRFLSDGREELFRAFGQCVESFQGSYITAEDMGTSVRDINVINSVTEFVSGRDPEAGGGGDPSPYTARGVFDGVRACIERLYGSADLRGRHVAIQGLGAVGMRLAELLAAEGAKITAADPHGGNCDKAAKEFGAKILPTAQIYDVEADIFSPCAIGAILNSETIPRLRCKVVAGAANNQLAHDTDEDLLQARGILYAPDFAINAGGVILCADEREPGGFTPERVDQRVAMIGPTVAKILETSAASGKKAGQVAIELAKERIQRAKAQR